MRSSHRSRVQPEFKELSLDQSGLFIACNTDKYYTPSHIVLFIRGTIFNAITPYCRCRLERSFK